jgi:sugar/nucleoside kinase (ribokinase family)
MHGPWRPRISGVGVACLDYLFVAPRAERGGQAWLGDHLIQGGGLIGTALTAAARLGAETEIWTWVGDDEEGRQVIAGLRREGVDVSAVERIAGARTPVSFIHVDENDGERTIFHDGLRRSRSDAATPDLLPAAPKVDPGLELPGARASKLKERPLSCDVLLVDAVYVEASQIAAARAWDADIPVVGDFCPSPGLEELTRNVTALIASAGPVDRAMPNATREQQLNALARGGPDFVTITAGSEGAYYLERGEVKCQPSFMVDVIDTTGAGDVFHGAFAYALARHWPPEQAVEFASAAAALSCRALGGRTAAPTLEETVTLLRQQGSDRWLRIEGG